MSEFFQFGGLAFWIGIAIFIILEIYTVETQGETEFEGPFGTLALAIIAYGLFYYKSFSQILSNLNWGLTSLVIVTYLMIGILWMLFKWKKFCKFKHERYLRDQKIFNRPISIDEYKPDVNKNETKQMLTSWVVLFPFFMLRYLCADFFGNLRDSILKIFAKLLTNVANSEFKAEVQTRDETERITD